MAEFSSIFLKFHCDATLDRALSEKLNYTQEIFAMYLIIKIFWYAEQITVYNLVTYSLYVVSL